jgi:hypothetical protein
MTPPLPPLDPPAAGKGIQLKMVSTIAAGQEIERCQFFQAPPEGLNINDQEVRYTAGSHHVLLYLTPYKTIPTVDNHGKTRETGGVVDCAQGASDDWRVSNVLGGAQSPSGGAFASFPPGVALKVPGNAVLLMNTHYLNAAPKDLLAEARINIYTIPDAEVKTEGGMLFFYNQIIRVPAQGQASARMRCPVSKDITVINVQSHMHRRAVNYVAQRLDAQAQLVDTLYTNTDWENVPIKTFAPGLVLPAGNFLDYRCDYQNHEDHDILQGPSTRDEMCMLIGSYYPRDDRTGFCIDATYVGGGSTSCGQSLSCVQTALLLQDEAKFYSCVAESCPGAAAALTSAVKCYVSRGGSSCKRACSSPADSGCIDCVLKACQPLESTCNKTSCN